MRWIAEVVAVVAAAAAADADAVPAPVDVDVACVDGAVACDGVVSLSHAEGEARKALFHLSFPA
jgi:hypothetical protein